MFSLKVFGSIGEPMNAETWEWCNTQIARNGCAVIDIWGQAETGTALLATDYASATNDRTPSTPPPTETGVESSSEPHRRGTSMNSPRIGGTRARPGMRPAPGMDAEVVDDTGEPVSLGQDGYLVLNPPWPAMCRTLWGNPELYQQTYYSKYPDRYFTGDGARIDASGELQVLGRVDDVVKVSGFQFLQESWKLR